MVYPHFQIVLGAFSLKSANIAPVTSSFGKACLNLCICAGEVISCTNGFCSCQICPCDIVKSGTRKVCAAVYQFFYIGFLCREFYIFSIHYKGIACSFIQLSVFDGGFYWDIHSFVGDACTKANNLIVKHKPRFFAF